MDDSERSYGYSEDIYHGRHPDAEKSYEYGAESAGDVEGSELSPEEQAIHIEGAARDEENVPAPDTPEYDFSRGSSYANVDSYTWDIPGGTEGNRGEGEREGAELPEVVGAERDSKGR